MMERRQLIDEHVRLWCEGCALLRAMTEREYVAGKSDRYYQFRDIDKALTWPLVSPLPKACSARISTGRPSDG
jgi:hypothetical protein